MGNWKSSTISGENKGVRCELGAVSKGAVGAFRHSTDLYIVNEPIRKPQERQNGIETTFKPFFLTIQTNTFPQDVLVSILIISTFASESGIGFIKKNGKKKKYKEITKKGAKDF
ncbi:MAG: hypothetical protein J6K31_08780 [Parabacteroides sp.]|nr:hypothetical protein [Parabacteroides sp.]